MSRERTEGADERGHSPRSSALSILLSCQRTDDALDVLIEQQAASIVQPRDRALVMELVYGVLRRQEMIDWRLGAVLSKPLHRLPVLVQILLRLGAYQLLFLDRVPASAAVNETVILAKSCVRQLRRDWSGLVNGVLRNLIRVPAPPLPDPTIRPAHSLSIRYGIPLWLAERWLSRLGFERAESACRASSTIPGMTLRVNVKQLTRDEFLGRLRDAEIVACPTVVSPVGVVLDKGQEVTLLPGFHEGNFYVEDEAAQLIPLILAPQPGEIILDACAAPGGKATHLAELMDDRGILYAVDRKAARLNLLRENCHRLRLQSIVPIVGDVRTPAQWVELAAQGQGQSGIEPSFDRILVDAPCSGMGILRRHPEAKRKKDSSAFVRHQALQLEILAAVAPCLRPDGVLVYSTCSTETEETEEVVSGFCKTHPEWMRESVAPWLPSVALPFVTDQGALCTMGNDSGMDGFYAVRLRKKS